MTMPNYAFGTVKVTGTEEQVLAFSKRFSCSDEQGQTWARMFWGSYASYQRKELTDSIQSIFRSMDPGCRCTVPIDVSFAWSAEGCLDMGSGPGAVDLATACKEDQVDVEILTVERTGYFEELIIGHSDGSVQFQTKDLLAFVCPACGTEQLLASFEHPEDAECGECGHIGLDELKEEVNENGT